MLCRVAYRTCQLLHLHCRANLSLSIVLLRYFFFPSAVTMKVYLPSSNSWGFSSGRALMACRRKLLTCALLLPGLMPCAADHEKQGQDSSKGGHKGRVCRPAQNLLACQAAGSSKPCPSQQDPDPPFTYLVSVDGASTHKLMKYPDPNPCSRPNWPKHEASPCHLGYAEHLPAPPSPQPRHPSGD